jgi:hypothetical protein
LRKKSIPDAQPLGASDFEGLTVSLKRYPDTKPEFFRSLLRGVQQFVRGGPPLVFAKVFIYKDLIVKYSKIMT